MELTKTNGQGNGVKMEMQDNVMLKSSRAFLPASVVLPTQAENYKHIRETRKRKRTHCTETALAANALTRKNLVRSQTTKYLQVTLGAMQQISGTEYQPSSLLNYRHNNDDDNTVWKKSYRGNISTATNVLAHPVEQQGIEPGTISSASTVRRTNPYSTLSLTAAAEPPVAIHSSDSLTCSSVTGMPTDIHYDTLSTNCVPRTGNGVSSSGFVLASPSVITNDELIHKLVERVDFLERNLKDIQSEMVALKSGLTVTNSDLATYKSELGVLGSEMTGSRSILEKLCHGVEFLIKQTKVMSSSQQPEKWTNAARNFSTIAAETVHDQWNRKRSPNASNDQTEKIHDPINVEGQDLAVFGHSSGQSPNWETKKNYKTLLAVNQPPPPSESQDKRRTINKLFSALETHRSQKLNPIIDTSGGSRWDISEVKEQTSALWNKPWDGNKGHTGSFNTSKHEQRVSSTDPLSGRDVRRENQTQGRVSKCVSQIEQNCPVDEIDENQPLIQFTARQGTGEEEITILSVGDNLKGHTRINGVNTNNQVFDFCGLKRDSDYYTCVFTTETNDGAIRPLSNLVELFIEGQKGKLGAKRREIMKATGIEYDQLVEIGYAFRHSRSGILMVLVYENQANDIMHKLKLGGYIAGYSKNHVIEDDDTRRERLEEIRRGAKDFDARRWAREQLDLMIYNSSRNRMT